ncbi:MAG: OmpA family protein [Myxococcota bacterium]
MYFETDQTILKPESFALLDNLAQVLKAHLTISLRIEGHTDNTEPRRNKELSAGTGQSVMAYLVHRH